MKSEEGMSNDDQSPRLHGYAAAVTLQRAVLLKRLKKELCSAGVSSELHYTFNYYRIVAELPAIPIPLRLATNQVRLGKGP